jgi:hypothetical protein
MSWTKEAMARTPNGVTRKSANPYWFGVARMKLLSSINQRQIVFAMKTSMATYVILLDHCTIRRHYEWQEC